MRVRLQWRAVLAATAILAVTAMPVVPSGAAGICRPWELVAVPDIPGGWLTGVSGSASDDVWAVGVIDESVPPIAMHWDGATWSSVDTPVRGTLNDVLTFGPDDAWAVGWALVQGQQPLLEHWDGSAWTRLALPIKSGFAVLDALTGTGPQDVWAMGQYLGLDGDLHGLALHWDGAAWTKVPVPVVGELTTVIKAAFAVAPDDVWAVGYWEVEPLDLQPITLHWDGVRWTPEMVQPPPPSFGTVNAFKGVAATGPDDAWAVGIAGGRPIIAHWDGASWSRSQPVRHRTGGSPRDRRGPRRAGVDGGLPDQQHDLSRPLSETWEGAGWRGAWPVDTGNALLEDIDIISVNDVWAVGIQGTNDGAVPVIEHSIGVCN